jgi:hypothetical protein
MPSLSLAQVKQQKFRRANFSGNWEITVVSALTLQVGKSNYGKYNLTYASNYGHTYVQER